MVLWQQFLLFVFAGINAFLFYKGLYESKQKRNAYGVTPFLLPLGIFVWGDAVVFGPFWALSALASLLLRDWYLFLLVISLFWVVRSLGETVYWFNQQFSSINRNPPEKMKGHWIFSDDSIWYVYQIIWQCVTVVSLIAALYFAKIWLDKF